MNNTTIKVGSMPGRIEEYALAEGTTVGEALALAGLNTEGFQVKLDGAVVDTNKVITSDARTLLLVKQVKGAVDCLIKVGSMPGRIEEYGYHPGATVGELLAMANLNTSGFQIKLDGAVVGVDTEVPAEARTLLLVKQVKGAK